MEQAEVAARGLDDLVGEVLALVAGDDEVGEVDGRAGDEVSVADELLDLALGPGRDL